MIEKFDSQKLPNRLCFQQFLSAIFLEFEFSEYSLPCRLSKQISAIKSALTFQEAQTTGYVFNFLRLFQSKFLL